MLRILAFLIFSQPAGVLADRTNRKTVLVLADLGRFALVSIFPFVTTTWQFYVLVFLVNALTAFFIPTFEACLPAVAIPSGTLPAEHTQDDRAYDAHFALTHACWLITYPAAGFATSRFGPALAITAAGVICIAITLVAARMNVREEGR